MTKETNDPGFIHALRKRLEKMREDYENSKVTCGIIGQSGTGKTSLIIALTGNKNLEVGIVETTGEPEKIPHKNSGVIFIDLPGCGTKKWPKSTYVNKLHLSSYDCFILVTAERFLENDGYLYRKIASSLHKPCFVVRNKLDRAIEDGKYDKNLTEDEVCKMIKSNIRENLLPTKLKKVYLTSARYPKRHDLPLLVTDISNSLHGIKKQRFIADMTLFSKEAFIEKRGVAEHLVGVYAGLAAANGINPIIGTDIAIDIGLLLKLSREVIHIYGLNEEQIDNAAHLENKVNLQALKQRSLQMTAKYLSKEAISLLLRKFGTEVTLKYASKWIPIVGQALAALLGYRLTYHFGENLIDDCESTAKIITDSMLD